MSQSEQKFSVVRWLKSHAPRSMLASAGNAIMFWRGDNRRFGVDDAGRWLNIQPEATFVSPAVYTGHHAQVESNTLDYWCANFRPKLGDTIIDVGAGIGEESVVFSELVGPRGRVISIEAHPETFACLKGTVERSGLANVVTIQCAIADREGLITMSDDDAHVSNSIFRGEGGVEVPAKTLDALLTELGIGKVDLLKMNIEGAEGPAMKGMTSRASSIRNVVISCHDFVAEAGYGEAYRTRDYVQHALERMGFNVSRRLEANNACLRDTLYGRRDQTTV